MSKIKVVVVPTYDKPYVAEIENELKPMQELVGGHIEVARLSCDCNVICNEEGLLMALPFNKWLSGFVGQLLIISSQINGDGEMVGLSEYAAGAWLRMFGESHE